MTARRLVVVGGGVAGLAAAWSARRAGNRGPEGLEVEVFERENEVGGKARTEAIDGWMVECGPSGFLSGRPELDTLIRDCGLAGELQPSNAASARRFLYRAGRMREIALSPFGIARAGILSPLGMLRLLAEPAIPGRSDGADESVWAFAARRLGREAADRIILPMMLGIFAGDARTLSLPAAFPRMAALERQYGSLVRARIARRGNAPRAQLTSFREGMQALPRALARHGDFRVHRSMEVRSVTREDGRWKIDLGAGEPEFADAVVIACEPFAAAAVIRAIDPVAAADLDAIPCPPVAVVSLGFARTHTGAMTHGFGVLVARGEGFRMLGSLWDSCIYDGRSPDGSLLLRAMFGGAVDPEAASLSDKELFALARFEIAQILGITAQPQFEHIARWPRAIPQYELGHLQRVARIEQRISALRGLYLAGSGLYGVSFADAVESGRRAGERAAGWLAAMSGSPKQ